MTPAGYEFRSFPRTGSRGGGIGFVTRTTMSACISFRALDYRSFEAVEMRLSLDHVSVVFVCLYRPPPSKRNKLTNSMFLEEFPELLSQYADSRRDVVYLGDFNFHYDDSSDGQVSRLKTLLSDHSLTQLVNVPTHKCGHILDWVVVHTESTCLSFEGVRDCPDLSDHKAVVCTLAVAKPSPRRRLVTSRNIKAICPSDFQCDVRALVEAASQQCSDSDLVHLVDVYNDGLRRLLDRHAPSVTRRVRDRPSAPWMTEEIREARRRRRQAERRWRETRLTVHREIYAKERAAVRACVQAAKRRFFCEKIGSSSSCRQLFAVSDELLGRSRTTSLPSD
ncbi:endonuclease/exonuclease/phosphatase family protein, partial [Thiolapillus sp.]|uniref:endonuclease/exonuclease/phosphatase family protein n=1 Tax=Thiolapillus sp. TaxID=2017437 RepID=UPI0035AB71FA